MTICTRPSCGADLDPASDEFAKSSCTHHPGAPFFHEGQKSWSCCKETNKPVLDFDDFVKIQGCTTVVGHSTEKRKQPEKSAAEKAGAAAAAEAAVKGASAGAVSHQPASQAPSSMPPPPRPPQPEEPYVYVEPSDPSTAVIAEGSPCKRPGCGATFAGGERDAAKEDCHYHKGVPIFHEGSKGYTCCKRRVLEFSEFMKIEPCTTATTGHLFTQPPKKKHGGAASAAVTAGSGSSGSGTASASGGDDALQSRGLTVAEDEDEAECRMDHYETPDEIRMTVYCKGVDVDQSKILLESGDVLLSLSLPPAPAAGNGRRRRHLLHLPLYADIETEPASSYTVSPSKIKIDFTLKKKVKGQSWPTLVRGGRGGGYGLTFGRT
ncbi:unnamed protein product [Parajaminaea phylloscopi]